MNDSQSPKNGGISKNRKKSKRDFLLVGIGASAGGVQALKKFFAEMPADSGMAFVVVLHLSQTHQSNLPEIIQRETVMPVTQVVEATKIEPNHVYVIPPAQQLEMVDGIVRLTKPQKTRGQRIAIDRFFRTLADAYRESAIGIILSGSGADGTFGIKRIKEQNGFAIVQKPEDAEFGEMPTSAIQTGLVDWILPIERMPEKLLSLRKSTEELNLTDGDALAPELNNTTALRDILTILRVRTGHDFSSYKQATLLRRIARHMQIYELDSLQDYVSLLREKTEEADFLLKNLLINVTNFFRDPNAWEIVGEEVIPRIFAGKAAEDNIRIWVAGCATGEEAYTIGILLTEYASRFQDSPKIQIFASDVDEDAIAQARDGIFPENITADVSPQRLKRFFVKEGKNYRVKKELREKILFAPHNLLRDPPFSKLDLIICRNVMIYLNRDAQERLMQLFHFALLPDGFLFLGSSESADNLPLLFTDYNKKQRIYLRRPSTLAAHPPLAMPSQGKWEVKPASVAPRTGAQALSFSELHFQLLEKYAPPSVLVNEDHDIVHLSDNAGRFLKFIGGEPTINIIKVVNDDLRADLRAALFAAKQDLKTVEARRIRTTLSGADHFVNLTIHPVEAPDSTGSFYLIIFEEFTSAEIAEEKIEKPPAASGAMDLLARHLEEELQRTKDRLRVTVEQYDTSIEELKASNEELQAINEELRSATEELETSKEELQFVNEELTTVNHELKEKIEEVSEVNSDLQNLMFSTEIGVIFLDRKLLIKRFTRSVQEYFNIINSDIGRPIQHLTHHFDYQNLAEDAQKVLRNLRVIEHEINTNSRQTFLVRLLPYRTFDDRIDGIVLTFLDITERKRAEEALRESEEKYRTLFDSMDEGVSTLEVIFDENDRAIDLLYLEHNHALTRLTGLTRDITGKRTSEVIPDLEQFWIDTYERVVRTGEPARVEHRIAALDSWFDVYAARVGGADSRNIVVVYNNITERKRREQQQEFLLKFSDALRTLPDKETIEQTGLQMLAEFLSLDRSCIATVYRLEDRAEIGPEYRRPELNLAPVSGELHMSDFPEGFRQVEEQTLVVDNIAADATLSELDRKSLGAINLTALVVASVRKGEYNVIWSLVASTTTARKWSKDEVRLIEEVAERIWAAVERTRAEESLRESKSRLQSIADLLPDLLWDSEPDGSTNWYNHRWLEYTGQSLEEALGWGWKHAIHPDDREESVRRYHEAVKNGEKLRQEQRIRRYDGEYRWFVVNAFPEKDENGKVIKVYGAATDIHELRLTNEALRVSEERLRLIMDGTEDYAILTLSEDGMITSWNTGAEKIFGYTREEAVGQNTEFIFTPEDRAKGEPEKEMQTAREQGRAMDERYHIRKDGTRFFVSGVLMRLRDNGKYAFAKIARDLSERKQFEDALKEADRKKDEFLATLAHELRNPLAPIRSGLEIVRKATSDKESRLEALGIIERQTDQMVRLVDDLLDISRITQGKIKLRKKRMNLKRAVEMALEGSREILDKANHELVVSMPKGDVCIDGDLTRITQIIQNVLNNAGKYTLPGGKIRLTIKKKNGEAIISVRDNGVGIPPGMLSKIFDMFSQIEKTSEQARGGMGIGLSVVKRLVEMHGGTIEAFSEGEGKGSEFIIHLPLAEDDGQPIAEEEKPTKKTTFPVPDHDLETEKVELKKDKSFKILVVDDNADAAQMLEILLSMEGHGIKLAFDAETGIQTAKEFKPDVCLLDIGLPGMNGYDAARNLREFLPDALLISISGWGQEEDRRRSKEAGFDHHLVKPVEIEDINKLLNDWQIP